MDVSTAQVTIDDIEHALGQISDIKAARVVASPEGTIQEVHILALPAKMPKQVVRDIESMLMVQFGITIDHKKISVAQLGQEALPESESRSPKVRAQIKAISVKVAGVHSTVIVTLEIEGDTYVGEASGSASQTGRRRLVAQATLNSIGKYSHDMYSFALEDVAVTQLGREQVAVSCVTLVSPTGEQAYAGSALMRQSEKDSIVRATLGAINRRLGFLTTP